MKKLFLTLFLTLGLVLTATAQKYNYVARSFAIGEVTYSGIRWGSWQSSEIQLCIDVDRDRFYIYSQSPQTYRVVNSGNWVSDGQGGKQIDYKVIDQDGDRGTCRLRIERNGSSQFYVFFADVAWVYGNLVRF